MRDLSPKQIVPRLADKDIYLASESSMYRLLKEKKQLKYRSAARGKTRAIPAQKTADGPNQIWSWDITWLPRSHCTGFFFLYAIMDVWSRKIVGHHVHPTETSVHACELVRCAHAAERVEGPLVLHSDNGAPMKGATMSETLLTLGITSSFSRPRVSNDNPFSEALFRSLKYRPGYPRQFSSLTEAREWSQRTTSWYNAEHLHSALRFVTPEQRHNGMEVTILERREKVYDRARRRRPERWTGRQRNWTPLGPVTMHRSD